MNTATVVSLLVLLALIGFLTRRINELSVRVAALRIDATSAQAKASAAAKPCPVCGAAGRQSCTNVLFGGRLDVPPQQHAERQRV